jgi:hypothetical protein
MTSYDLISITLLLLSGLWILFVVFRMLGPADNQTVALAAPTLSGALPTLTPSVTFTPSDVPTFTLTPTWTSTPTASLTPTETAPPSATITVTQGPTDTPSLTFTPSISPTFTPSITPTGPTETFTPTLSPFLFALRDQQVVFTRNTFNSQGCAWQGIGGQVFDENGIELNSTSGLQVHVFGSGIDARAQVGTNSFYGVSGWEQAVDTKINANTYFVELLSAQGTAISDRIQVSFPSNCEQNAALVRFYRTRAQ